MNRRAAVSTPGIILVVVVFLIVFVTGLAPVLNVASDVNALSVTSGIPALFFQNLTFWVLMIFFMAILWMVASG